MRGEGGAHGEQVPVPAGSAGHVEGGHAGHGPGPDAVLGQPLPQPDAGEQVDGVHGDRHAGRLDDVAGQALPQQRGARTYDGDDRTLDIGVVGAVAERFDGGVGVGDDGQCGGEHGGLEGSHGNGFSDQGERISGVEEDLRGN